MRSGPDIGLRQISTPVLKDLLRRLHRREIEAPLTPLRLTAIGLQEQAERLMGSLRGLDGAAIRAVLVATLAERIES